MKICGIYKITSPVGKIYIGQSVDVNSRFRRYRKLHAKSQRRLITSLKMHGWESHKKEILIECMPSDLYRLEIFYSEKFNSLDYVMGLNIRGCGGNSGSISHETKNRISKANIGKKRDEATILKIKYARSKQIITPEHKEKLRMASLIKNHNRGKHLSESQKDNLRKLYIGKTGQQAKSAKKIIQLNLNEVPLKEWYGAPEIQRNTGFKCASINRAARGERHGIAYGFKWKYA